MSLPNNVNATGSSSTNFRYFRSKPMSISSLTSSPLPNETVLTTRHELYTNMNTDNRYERSPNTHNLPYISARPPSSDHMNSEHATQQNYKANETYFQQQQQQQQQHQQPQQRRLLYHGDEQHPHQYHPYQQRDTDTEASAAPHYSVNIHTINQFSCNRTRSSSISSTTSFTAPPLTLKERRQRNKAASAKYRAKKNQEQGDMRMLISSVSSRNDLLQRQLDELKRDNEKLRTTCDRLRGKLMAERMFERLLNNQQQQRDLQALVDDENDDNDNDNENDNDDDEDDQHNYRYNGNNGSTFHANSRQQFDSNSAFAAMNSRRYEEDIHFEDDDEQDDDNQPRYNTYTQSF